MNEKRIILNNEINELSRLNLFLEQTGEEWGLSPKLVMNINLVIEEAFSNETFYAYNDSCIHEIEIHLRKTDEMLVVRIIDDGIAFNPLELPVPDDIDKPLEERKIGGLGIHFIKSLVDNLHYERAGDRNILTLEKRL